MNFHCTWVEFHYNIQNSIVCVAGGWTDTVLYYIMTFAISVFVISGVDCILFSSLETLLDMTSDTCLNYIE